MREIQDMPVSNDRRWAILQRKAQEVRAVDAFRLFRSHGIEPVLIKGLAASYSYPADRLRMSIDMDLAVAAQDFDKARQICVSGDASGLAIDLHNELRHLDTVDWPDLFSKSITVDVDGVPLRFLRPEDHLRLLSVHWLTDGGANRERLWDIYYIVRNRGLDFDWDRFFGVVSAKRQGWLKCVLGLAEKYLDLDLSETPAAGAAKDLPAWLVRAVEREWSNETPVIPLGACLNDRKLLLKQVFRRLPPNPIQATIDMEGTFDARSRVYYQIASAIKRARHASRMSPQPVNP